MATSSSLAARRTRANESFGCAAQCIGKVEAGMSLFAVTRGQWSMIDAVLHVLDQVGPAKLSSTRRLTVDAASSVGTTCRGASVAHRASINLFSSV